MDYFTELSQNYTGFKNYASEISKEDRVEPSLQHYAKIIWNALQDHRKGLSDRPDFSRFNSKIQKEEKSKYFSGIKTQFKQAVSSCNGIVENAGKMQEGLKNAGKPQQPESSTEIALQGEIRSRLREMSVSERIAALQNQAQNGDFRVFESIINDPLPISNFLGTPNESSRVLGDAREQYVQQKFPDVWERAVTTAHNAETATAMKSIAEFSCVLQNEAAVGL
jgi:hypothetical protein